jgi:hypothetical protein
MEKLLEDIVYDFYWASSDLAANLKFLSANPEKPSLQQSTTDPKAALPLTIPALRKQFEKYATPFMAIEVLDLPEDQRASFGTIIETMDDVLPALDVLEETWEDFTANPAANLARLRHDCDYIRCDCELEMLVVTPASCMAKDMKPGIL